MHRHLLDSGASPLNVTSALVCARSRSWPPPLPMNADPLAILGGTPLISEQFPPYRSIGEEEVHAVACSDQCTFRIHRCPGAWFLWRTRGANVGARAAERFGVNHVVAVNSWTSGLVAAIGAIGIAPEW